MKSPIRFYIEIDGEYFRTGKTYEGNMWVSKKRDASRFIRSTALTYVRDWKKYGAKMVRVGR